MLVNSVSMHQNIYGKKLSDKAPFTSNSYIKNTGCDSVSFSGVQNPAILRNQLKILLTQDIWSNRLAVKMPESPLEKEVILEILNHRANLDRFTRLSNEKAQFKSEISYAEELSLTNPNHADLAALRAKIAKRGNTDSVIKSYEKAITLEKKKNQRSYDYFKDIENLQDEYLDKNLIKISKMEKFWHQIKKNNINKEQKYTTRELIDIISKNKAPEIAKTGTKDLIISKKQLLARIEKQYEQQLRENINIYSSQINYNAEAQINRNYVNNLNAESIKKFPEIEKQVTKIYENMEAKFAFKADRLGSVDIYPIGEIWKDMSSEKNTMKKLSREISDLKKQYNLTPDNKKIGEMLSEKEKILNECKNDWLEGLKYSVEYEQSNRLRMANAGRVAEYDYLTSENKTLNSYKKLYQIYKNNENTLPQDVWQKIIG